MNLLQTLIGLIAVFSFTLTTALAEPILIRFSHVVAEQTPKGVGANRFKQLVEEKLAGRVKVEVFPNANLYNDDEVFTALLDNDVQLAAPSLSKFSIMTKALQVYDLPFLFDDPSAVEHFQRGEIGQRLLTALDGKGIKGLGYWSNGMRVISANRPLRTPTDLRQLSLRVEPSKVIEAQYRQFGAIPIKLPFTHTRDALRREVIDGQENTWSNIYSQGFQASQTYITETHHSFLGYMVITNKTFWDQLPADVRRELETILGQVTEEVKARATAQARQDRQAIIDEGRVQLIALTDQDRERWRQAMIPVWKSFASQIDPEIIAVARAANARNR
ncbi:MAG: DctP family TRAP transporter solute-binding subunit [Candidatus Competibacter sp.]|nr:DctP family TRAP transporter solute-binding subunit [Candidatus Competibacter sp.]MDG4584160.1 DctP family TRAP transporter solute-binding subunit [Candidatus Competibacter sp.]